MYIDTAIVDSQGRVYLKENIRKKAGIKTNSVVEIIAEPGQIIIRPKKPISEELRGVFKLKKKYRDIRDIDALISSISIEELKSELE